MTNPVTQNAYLVANGTGTIFPTVVFNRPPGITDFYFPITQRWIDTSDSNAEWFLLDFLSSAGVVSPNWIQLASGAATTETLTGNTGGAVGADGSFNINVVGDSSGIQFAGNPGTHTLTGSLANIPNSSLAHSSITLVAGTGISISVSPVSLGGSTTISSTLALSAFNQIHVQTFTTNGTYTPTAGMKYCTIELVGGGGGSGGTAAVTGAQAAASAGGGAGGYSRKTVTSATIGASQTVTIGAGGAAGASGANAGGTGGSTSVGILLSSTGGTGGAGGVATAVGITAVGGAGGVGSSGDVNIQGSPGIYGIAGNLSADTILQAGPGGSSYFGGGAAGGSNNAPTAGGPYGGGAGGASAGVAGVPIGASPGAAGGDGVVIITEYLSV